MSCRTDIDNHERKGFLYFTNAKRTQIIANGSSNHTRNKAKKYGSMIGRHISTQSPYLHSQY